MSRWNQPTIKIYTDGSSSPKKTKEAGWGFALYRSLANRQPIVHCGYLAPPSTNNIAELLGVIHAIEFTTKFKHTVKIFTDSEYVEKCLLKRKEWERVGMPPANNDLIFRLWRAFDAHAGKVEVKWIKGHAGHEGNEVADAASRWGKEQDKSFFGKGKLMVEYNIDLNKIWYHQNPEDFTVYLSENNLR